ncbi:cytochrome c oxidase assembly factor 3, mitochondrial-like [Xylocopa sonorina]|uniref:cytochrome c oxidase assembly factor 3, mitochondrial-like n=1 Tax=Xylocopa sonorina TaxID=1818115 RepID=UPI00403ADD99
MQPDENKSDFMQKLDLVKDKSKLKYSDIIYMKQAEEVAIQKALKYKYTRRKCNIAAVSLACLVVGIYAYTIHAVKQETFLDNLDEPEKIIEKPTSNTNLS